MAKQDSLVSLKSLLFLFFATNTIILTFLPLYLQYKGLSGTEIGWVLAIGPFASIISQPFWGYLSDKYKTVKRMLILSVIGMIIASLIFFQMNALITILIVGAIFYFFSSPVGALSDSLAQRRADELGISFGTIRMWGSLGFAFTSLVVGEFLTKFGIQYIGLPYLLFATILLLVVFTINDVQTDSTPVSLKDIGKITKNKAFIFFLLTMMLISITHRAYDSFIGIYITELGGSERLVGIAWFVGVISEATIFATARFWFRKFHPLIFIVLASIFYSMRWFFYGSATSPFFVISLQFFHGLTFGVFYVAAFDYVTRIIPRILHSTGHLVFYSVFFGVSGIIGSMAGGYVLERFGGHTLYMSMGVIAVIGTIFFILYYVSIQGKKELEIKSE